MQFRDLSMITGVQIRSGRAALGWPAKLLAERSGIGLRTLLRIESFDGVPPSHSKTLIELKRCLESAGIEFIGTPDDGPGIRLRIKDN